MSFVMSYPVVTPTDTVTLNNPNLGNTIRLNTNSVTRKTLARETRAYKDSGWPNHITQLYNFSSIRNIDSSSTLYTLREFLETTAGLQIKIVDHNGDTWHGYITSPINEIVTIHDDCSFDIGFEFIGVKQ